jgi:hypothetical protein
MILLEAANRTINELKIQIKSGGGSVNLNQIASSNQDN